MDTSSVLHDHLVHFYDDEHTLERLASDYLGRALLEGGTAIAITTPAHGDAFCLGIAALGVDVESALIEGRLVLADAASTLSSFMLDATPDSVRFDAVVGSLIRRAGSGGSAIHAYGEMVALLWEKDNVAGAIELERLWNVLARETSFSLFCAYPSWSMERSDLFEAFSDVCLAHSEVIAGAPAPPGVELSRRFPKGRHAPGQARHFVAAALREWGLEALVEGGMLIATELATNALTHARSGFTVSLSRSESCVRITVGDLDPDAPEPRASNTSTTSGRGLQLVDSLSSSWGHVAALPAGKFVWADLATAPEVDVHGDGRPDAFQVGMTQQGTEWPRGEGST